MLMHYLHKINLLPTASRIVAQCSWPVIFKLGPPNNYKITVLIYRMSSELSNLLPYGK